MKLIAEIKGKKREFELKEGERYVVGRDISCDVTLPAGSVSRRHAELRVENGEIIVRDFSSKNGTFAQGERIQEARVKPGDKLNIGHVLVEFEVDAPGSGAASRQVAPVVDDEDEASDYGEFHDDPTPTPLDDSFIPDEMKEDQPEEREEGASDKTSALPEKQSAQLQKAGEFERNTSPPPKAGGKMLTKKEKMMFLLPAIAVVLIMLLVIILSGLGEREEELTLSRSEYNQHIDRAVTDFNGDNIESALDRLNRLANYMVDGDPQTHRLLISAIETNKLLQEPDSFESNWRRGRELWDDVQNYAIATENARQLATQQVAWVARESRNMALYKRLTEELEEDDTEDALQTAAEIPRDSMFFELAHQKAEGLRDEVVQELIRQGREAEEGHDWDDAIELYERAEYLSPVDIEEVSNGLARAKRYKEEQSRANRALQLIDQGQAQEAIRLLADIDPEGPYHDRAEDLRLQAATHQERNRAVSRYNEGEAESALSILEDSGLGETELYRKIRDVKTNWDRVQNAISQADFATARAAAQSIIDLENSNRNRYRLNAREFIDTWRSKAQEIARAVRNEGVQALEDGRLSEARDKFEEAWDIAREADPNTQIGRQDINTILDRARQRYNEALNIETRNPDAALEIYKDIRSALRIGDPYYERTLDAIDRLERE